MDGEGDSVSDSASGRVSARAGVSVRARASVTALTGTEPRLAYRVFGERGAPVLFAMGFGMPGGVWALRWMSCNVTICAATTTISVWAAASEVLFFRQFGRWLATHFESWMISRGIARMSSACRWEE